MKRTSELNLANLLEVLSAQKTLNFRIFLRRESDEWKVQALRVDNFIDIGNQRTGFLNYGEFAFVFGKASGSTISRWLEAKRISVENQHYTIPEFQQNITEERYPSDVDLFWLKLPFPYTVYRLRHFGEDRIRDNYDPLIAEGVPSFPSLGAASYTFLYEREYQNGQSLPEELIFCIARKECWLEKIHLYPSSVVMEINGTSVKGTRLEMWAGLKHFETLLKKRGSKTFQLPKGLPERIWIVLTRGNEWLDYREIDLRSSHLLDKKGVVVETTSKPTQIKGLIARGEGETTEFKVQVPTPNESSTLTKTVAAFANGIGGVIIIGVEDKTGLIIGIRGDVEKEKERLAQILRNNIAPQPVYRIESCEVNSVYLFLVHVEAGVNVPYGINPPKLIYYVRRGASTFSATQEEIRALVKRDDDKLSMFW